MRISSGDRHFDSTAYWDALGQCASLASMPQDGLARMFDAVSLNVQSATSNAITQSLGAMNKFMSDMMQASSDVVTSDTLPDHEASSKMYEQMELISMFVHSQIQMARTGANFASFNPLFAHSLKNIRNRLEVFDLVTRSHSEPEWGIKKVSGGVETSKTLQPELIDSKPFGDLIKFSCEKPDAPDLLLCAPMSGHYATLLRGTVQGLVKDHNVYVTDWNDPQSIPLSEGDFALADYVDYLQDFIRKVGPSAHTMAVCQPSVPLMAAVSLMPENERPQSTILMGGPIDTRQNPTEVNKFAQNHSLKWFQKSLIHKVPYFFEGAGRSVYPGRLQLMGFMAPNMHTHLEKFIKLGHHLDNGEFDEHGKISDFYREYLAVMDLPAEYYLQTLDKVFIHHDLPQGRLMIRDQFVDLGVLQNTALMTIEGQNDDITGIGQTYAAHDLCDSLSPDLKLHYEQAGAGHYGIFNGSKWKNQVLPQITEFIARRNRGEEVRTMAA